MIPKKGWSCFHTEYRPISLLSCIGKVVERVMKNRLYPFLESNKLIVKEQSGFRSKRGTADNLIFVNQKIQEALNRSRRVCGVFFDISKAFDKVWHAGVLYKLIRLNVPKYIIRFMKSFLENRHFKVKVNRETSGVHTIEVSVPQGSVLGPIAFLIAIGDIPLSNLRNVSYSDLFADDLCSIFFFSKKTGRVVRLIKAYLESFVAWLFKWRLRMNASKCCYTIFSNRGRGGLDLDLRLKGEPIPYNKNPTYLGITFDEHLNFNKHYEILRSRALKRLNIIKIFSHKSWLLSKATLVRIYGALVGSIFDYSVFTVASVSDTSLKRIQSVQNRSIRCIYKLKWDSPTTELPIISGLIPIRSRFLKLGSRYLTKCIIFKNELTSVIIEEYVRSFSAITAGEKFLITPLCLFTSLVALAWGLLYVWTRFLLLKSLFNYLLVQ